MYGGKYSIHGANSTYGTFTSNKKLFSFWIPELASHQYTNPFTIASGFLDHPSNQSGFSWILVDYRKSLKHVESNITFLPLVSSFEKRLQCHLQISIFKDFLTHSAPNCNKTPNQSTMNHRSEPQKLEKNSAPETHQLPLSAPPFEALVEIQRPFEAPK